MNQGGFLFHPGVFLRLGQKLIVKRQSGSHGSTPVSV